ncbi:MAG: PAS domain S-box-containing protein [Bacteriovoracaceae bacterium]|jgi:PAS domain S-box-containing protein
MTVFYLKYIYVFIFGLLFPVFSIFFLAEFDFSKIDIIHLHKQTPLLYVIDTAPFVLVTLVLLLDYYFQKKQNKLRYIEALHEKVITNSFNGIVVADNKGNIIYTNNAAQELFGYNNNELINQNLTILMPDTYREMHSSGMKKHNDTGKKNVIGKGKVELEGQKKNGDVFPMNLILSTFHHNDSAFFSGEIQDLSTVVKNQNERDSLFEQVNTQKDFYENILNNIPVDIAVFDENHKYLFVNPQAIKNDDLRSYIIGKDDFDYCKYVERDSEIANLRRDQFNLIKKTRTTIEWQDSVKSDAGVLYTVLRKFYPVFNKEGEFDMAIGFGLDITESIEKDKELLKLAEYPKENPNIIGRFNLQLESLFLNEKSIAFFNNSDEKIKAFNKVISPYLKDSLSKNKVIVRDVLFDNNTFAISFVPILANNYINIYGTNITDFKREIEYQRQALLDVNRSLEISNSILEKDAEQRNLEISIINKGLNSSIIYAKKLQSAVIAHQNLAGDIFKDSFIFYLPKGIVGGDFYFTYKLNNELIFGVADCTGHGVPGAMLSLLCMTFLETAINAFKLSSPKLILEKVNMLLKNSFNQGDYLVRDGMDISILNYSKEKSELTFAGAKSKMLVIQNNERIIVDGDHHPIGYWVGKEKVSFTNTIIPVNGPTNVFMFTDGLVDQFGGEKGKKLKYSKFYELLFSVRDLSSKQQKEAISQFTKEWMGSQEQIDDITVAGVKF